MPSRMGSKIDLNKDFIRVKTHYSGHILITNLDASMSYAELCDEVHEMCNLQQEQPITLKWIDDEDHQEQWPSKRGSWALDSSFCKRRTFFKNQNLKFNVWLDTGVITWPGYYKVTCNPRRAAGK